MKFRSTIFITALILSQPFIALSQQVNQVSSPRFFEIIQNQDGILLDVRTEQEFQSGHIENSGQMNFYARDFAQQLLQLPKDRPIYLYCNTGRRSNIAAQFLIRNGYTQVYNLQRGIVEWNHAGLPVTVPSHARMDVENSFNQTEFERLISSGKLVFVDFYAPWCGPCMQMMPMIDEMKSRFEGRIEVVKINADASRPLMRQLSISSIPHLVLYKNGDIVFEHTGLIEENRLFSILQSHYEQLRRTN